MVDSPISVPAPTPHVHAPGRRRMLVTAASVVGGLGVGVALIPFVRSMNPSDKARAAAGPITLDVSKLEYGQQITVQWRNRPVWVLRRTAEMLADLRQPSHLERLRDPDSRVASQQPRYAQNPVRAIRPELFVVIGVCTHLGCIPNFRPDKAPADLGPSWIGGYFCPCHGSRFDLAGRVYLGVPAPTNLVVPPHRYVGASVIQVGVG